MINYSSDKRIVMTLDAGGTNFVFSAIAANAEVVNPISVSAPATDLKACLASLVEGFNSVKMQLTGQPVAISFAFPGPADYPSGVIGDLQNFPAFRGGIPLGPFLSNVFGIPVFINNDGDLFAYGEAMCGLLPEVNSKLQMAGCPKEYRNLLGITLGTGFGAGIVTNQQLLIGDNSAAGEIWVTRNKIHNHSFAEESVSKRAIQWVYADLSGNKAMLTPKDIFDIAEGVADGNKSAAIEAFRAFGEATGDAIANAVTLIDGLVVIGGGLSGASKYFMPAIMKELNGNISTLGGQQLNRLEMKAYNLDEKDDLDSFCKGKATHVQVPTTDLWVKYDYEKRIGVGISKLGASKAISLGAYAYALNNI